MGMRDPTKSPGKGRLARLAIAAVAAFALVAQPAMAQSILRDAETEAFFADMARPIVEASGLRPENVEVALISDREINAFVAGRQIVYFNSGLITTADSVNEVQGVFAHELGHITGGHVILGSRMAERATGITLLSLLLGVAAMAAGAGEAGAGIMAAGQQAALGSYLSYSRTQEAQTDQAGARYLSGAGISGKGSLSFFKKLQNMEFRYSVPQDQESSYWRTHPLTGERISNLQDMYQKDAAWNKPVDPALEARFQRIKAKLAGFVDDPDTTLRKYPETDQTIPGHYARAYAWHRGAYPDKANQEADALLRAAPNDPYFLELKGQILLESGKPREALEPLRRAVQLSKGQPLIVSMFGHALIATEDKANFAEAKQVLRNAIARDNRNPFAWYQLGIIYDREGDHARAALATAERYNLEGQPKLALAHADRAVRSIPTGTTDWLRAQDIAMVSRAEVERKKR